MVVRGSAMLLSLSLLVAPPSLLDEEEEEDPEEPPPSEEPPPNVPLRVPVLSALPVVEADPKLPPWVVIVLPRDEEPKPPERELPLPPPRDDPSPPPMPPLDLELPAPG